MLTKSSNHIDVLIILIITWNEFKKEKDVTVMRKEQN